MRSTAHSPLRLFSTPEFPPANTPAGTSADTLLARTSQPIEVIPPLLTYTGPEEILYQTPVTLRGHFDPRSISTVRVSAEDKYPFTVVLSSPLSTLPNTPQSSAQLGTWEVQLSDGFYQAGARWLRLQGLGPTGVVVADQVVHLLICDSPLTVGEALSITVTQATFFKQRPSDSAELSDSQRVWIEANQGFTVQRYRYDEGHLLVELDAPLGAIGQIGYFYGRHVRLAKGTQPIVFEEDQLPPMLPGAVQVWVTQDTLLKAEPVDSSELSPEQRVSLHSGQTLQALGYACYRGHFRLTLTEPIPGFGRTGYLFYTHGQLRKPDPSVPTGVREIDYDPDPLLVRIKQPTLFKKRPVNGNNLKPNEQTPLEPDHLYGVVAYAPADAHVLTSLSENFPGFGNSGYLYPPHVQFSRGNKPLDPLPDQVELSVPYLSQRDNRFQPRSTCNVTALAMIMRYYGRRSRSGRQLEDELYQWCVNRYGPNTQTDNTVLVQLARSYGFVAQFSTQRTWLQIQTQLRLRRPVMLGGYFTAGGHIVCVTGFNSSGYWVHDPWGDALTGYRNTNGRRRFYPRGYLEKMCSPEGAGNVWAHFLAPRRSR